MWQDTVMKNDKIVLKEVRIPTGDSIGDYPVVRVEKDIDIDATLLAQAEISFKAGQDSVFDSMPENLPPLLEAAHRSGIREVVEWMEINANIDSIRDEWQAKLKEWGIDEEG